MTIDRRKFMLEEVPSLLSSLDPDTEPRFGLMTAQHMVEHILNDGKYMYHRLGEPVSPLTEKQKGFQKFIDNGVPMKHRPSDKTKADLPELKFENLEAAVAEVVSLTQKFYEHFEANPDFMVYNSFMGELPFEKVELFFSQHWRYHLWQFKLIDQFS
ncbi:MAG: hypothetical protein AAFR87_03290 [Bacteroidota bacterium]